ncbi:MAG TPA: hypothetical protein VFN62_08685 [Acidobacteriaceae bacterium]|nr:hypothetical protein [Acidobacteriaceae bacterium]
MSLYLRQGRAVCIDSNSVHVIDQCRTRNKCIAKLIEKQFTSRQRNDSSDFFDGHVKKMGQIANLAEGIKPALS